MRSGTCRPRWQSASFRPTSRAVPAVSVGPSGSRTQDPQNMGWSLAALSGTGCKTSQCSTILPTSKRKKSAAAVFGRGLQQAVRHNQVAFGDGALDVEAHLGELLHEALYELDERFEPVGGLGVVLNVVRSAVLFHCLGGLPVVEC